MPINQILLTLAFLFFIGSTAGWVLELFFRRLFGDKKWVNPGFLKGPYLPIYGFGVCILFLLCRIPLDWIPYRWLQITGLLACMCFCLTLIEYVGGVIFIKGMKIKLWDYSNQWGNVQGIICPLYSFLWTAAGALYYFLLDDFFYNSIEWFWNNLAFAFIVGLFFGIFLIDLAQTTSFTLKLRKFAADHNVVLHYEELKGTVQDGMREMKQKFSFISPFKNVGPWLETFLKTTMEKMKEAEKNRKKKGKGGHRVQDEREKAATPKE